MPRQLAAIMFTDITGYTAMMQADEEAAINIRNRHRSIYEQHTHTYRGNNIQYFGDGTLTIFNSSVDAVNCAIALQKSFRENDQIPVRIGIHVGDIVLSDHDIIGDAVNIASRIESVALPGSVYFSSHVNDQLRSHSELKTVFVKIFDFKNVGEPIPVFAIVHPQLVTPQVIKSKAPVDMRNNHADIHSRMRYWIGGSILLALILAVFVYYSQFSLSEQENDKIPVVKMAILPLQNLTGDESWDLTGDNVTDELLSEFSRVKQVDYMVPKSVVNDLMKKQAPLVEWTRELNVRYAVESALHQHDSTYSMDVRLIDPRRNSYVWSRRYEGILDAKQLLSRQASIAADLLAIMDRESGLHNESVTKMVSDNQEAKEYVERANRLTDRFEKESFYQAIPLYEKAIQLDPDMAEAYFGLGRVNLMGGIIWGVFNQDQAAENAKKYINQSLEIEPTLEASQFLLVTKFFFDQDFRYVDEHVSLVAILPDFADGAFYVVYCNTMGRFDEGIRYANQYVKRFTNAGNGYAQMIRAYFLSGQTAQADSLMAKYDPIFSSDQFYIRDVAMVHLNMGHMREFKEMNAMLKSEFLDHAPVHVYYEAVELTEDGADPKDIQVQLDLLERHYKNGQAGSPAWFLAMYYFHVGEENKAFEWLGRSQERKEVEMVWFKTEYRLQPYREAGDPRYVKLYDKMEWPPK